MKEFVRVFVILVAMTYLFLRAINPVAAHHMLLQIVERVR